MLFPMKSLQKMMMNFLLNFFNLKMTNLLGFFHFFFVLFLMTIFFLMISFFLFFFKKNYSFSKKYSNFFFKNFHSNLVSIFCFFFFQILFWFFNSPIVEMLSWQEAPVFFDINDPHVQNLCRIFDVDYINDPDWQETLFYNMKMKFLWDSLLEENDEEFNKEWEEGQRYLYSLDHPEGPSTYNFVPECDFCKKLNCEEMEKIFKKTGKFPPYYFKCCEHPDEFMYRLLLDRSKKS